MTITKEQREGMLEAAKPLMKWLNDNCHPHCKAIVEQANIELLEGLASHGTMEFVKD